MIGKKILPIIMEKDLLDIRSWPSGIMTMYLGNTFYIDCSGTDISDTAKKLSKMLQLLGLKKKTMNTSHKIAFKSHRSINTFIKI